MNLKKELQKSNVIAVIMPSKLYSQKYPRIIEATVNSFNKMCYVTLAKPYHLLNQKYKDKAGKIFYVDAVTKKVIKKPKKAKNVAYVSSQTAYNELKKTIDDTVKKTKVRNSFI